MITSIIGGGLVAGGFLLIAILRGGGQREPKPFWARSEGIESMVAVGIVTMLALGFALIVSAAGKGWLAPVIGLGLAFGGCVLAVMIGPRRTAPTRSPASPA